MEWYEIVGLAVVPLAYALTVVGFFKTRRLQKRFPKMTTDELYLWCDENEDSNQFGAAVKELANRGKDIAFSFPVFLDWTLSLNDAWKRAVGKSFLNEHFSELLGGKPLKLSIAKVTREERERLLALREKWNNLAAQAKASSVSNPTP